MDIKDQAQQQPPAKPRKVAVQKARPTVASTSRKAPAQRKVSGNERNMSENERAVKDERAAKEEVHHYHLAGWQFWSLNLLALVVLVLVVVNIFLTLDNQNIRAEVNQRQRFINESMQFSRLNNQLIRTLAKTSAQKGDVALRDLLAAQGISFTVNPAASDGSAAGSAKTPSVKAKGTP